MRYDMKESGKRIQSLRKLAGLTQEQLAEAVNISTSSLTIKTTIQIIINQTTRTAQILSASALQIQKLVELIKKDISKKTGAFLIIIHGL